MQCAAAVIVQQVLKASFCVNSSELYQAVRIFIYEDKCFQIPFALKLTEFGLSVWRIGQLLSPLHLCPCLAKVVHDWKPGSCLTLSLSIDKIDGGRFDP